MSDNRHSGGGYSIQAVQIEPKENEDKNDDDEHEHRLCLLIEPNDTDMLALQAELSAESLQRLTERIKDIAAVYPPSVFVGVIEHQIAIVVVMIEERSHSFILP